mmetsp:Transcript_29320/g.73768  ORF Transcript_29320/g.73768 Transcript_29320/m.73768 type:complete len:402 (-) Transcript_29320:150-1355(-)|eukprot:CAMPEP_0177633476 /NCGR_PEP_ID=MMETSP0447-20121125/2858_1 /TAXON_ID=0 /ORGANISM="Stygamoeba regulata, Strain BSH-02190019" /LENGTH=401 /DNA_ID=CAMNT_0019135139 /DNA_START=358 /DNA_END=1563 /DNA_ORIENTATION=-
MADKKKGPDPATILTQKTITELKATYPDVKEFLGILKKYHDASVVLCDLGDQLWSSLEKLSSHNEDDVGENLKKLAASQKEIEARHRTVAGKLNAAILEPMREGAKTNHSATESFEVDLNRQTEKMLSDLKKLEKESKKAGKKSPEILQQAISNVTNKVKDLEDFRVKKLREVLLMERRQYCTLLSSLCTVVQAQSDAFSQSHRALDDQQAEWKRVAESAAILSEPVERKVQNIMKPDRTFVQIVAAEQGEASSYYPDSSSAAWGGGGGGGVESTRHTTPSAAAVAAAPIPPPLETSLPVGVPVPEPLAYEAEQTHEAYDEGYDEEMYSEYTDQGYPAPPPNAPKALAMFDYVGTHDYELSFVAGDMVTIVTEDEDGSGWWTGELNGKIGPFPGNYVQKLE